MSNKGILLGANSFIGGYFASFAKSRDLDVIAFDRSTCNLLNPSSIESALSKVSAGRTLILCSVIGKNIDNSYPVFKQNIAMIENLCAILPKLDVRSVIYLSTADIYGNKPVLPLTEESKIDPDSWYPLAKCASEWMLKEAVGKTPLTILRFPGIYGDFPGDKSIIKAMVATLRAEKKIRVTGEGSVLRDYIYVGDIARLIECLIDKPFNGILNIATGKSIPLSNVASIVLETLALPGVIEKTSYRDERQFDLVFDNSRLKAAIPNFKFTELPEGISSYKKLW